MKKFFSLLCATLLVFSASAAPVAKKAEITKKAPVAVEQMQKVQFEKAQIADFNQLSATPAVKVNNFKPQSKIGPKELAAQSRSVAPKKAPQDYTTTYNYKCGPTEVVVTDLSTPTYNEFKLVITQKAKNIAEYSKETLYDNTVELIIDPDEHSIVGTFTTDDYTISSNTFLKSGSNTRYVSYWENSTITIESKGGNKYAITDGLLQVENSKATTLYKYDYCYAAADLNNQDAEKTAFEFTFGEEPTPATWDTIGKSSVKDGVVAYLLGDTEDAAAYNITTLQNGTSYKMVNLFGSANPAYNKIKDLASYKKAEIEIDATDANNVTIAKQKIGWTGTLFQEVYEIEASNGKLANGVITFAAANIKFYEDGETPYKDYGDLVITLPKEEPKIDTIPVTVAAYQEKYYASSYDWQVILVDAAGNGWSLDIFAPAEGFESGKTYTSDNGDFDLDYTFAQVNKVNDAAVKASFTKTETEDALTVTAEMTTAGNHVYQFTYNLDKTVEIVDANGIIIQPAKGTTKEYNRLATNTCFYYNEGTKLAYQSGTATLVECADGTVYWKDPISAYTSGAWIKGKKEGSTITFATKQPVYYNTSYKASLSVRWGNFDTEKFAAADDYADSFILDIKGDSLIMRGTQATLGDVATYFPGIFWDDDNSFSGNGDCGVTLIEKKPIVERDTVDVISNKMIYNDFIAGNAAVQYYAGADAGYTQFCVTSKNATSVFGTFDVWADYSWINFTETTGTDIQEGQITVTEAEDGVHLTGYVIGNDEKYYRLNWFMEAGILPSDTDAPFEAEFAWSEMSASIEDGVIGIYATNAENLTIGLELYTDPTATEIPAGTYVISDTQEASTALQSLGVVGGYLTECWAGVRTATGISDCWFMVEGTITLSYDEYGKLKVEVDAKNSYGQPVTALVQYTAPEVTDYYLVGWINGAAYGIEGDIDNFGDYHFVAGEDGALKVKATFNETSYVQVKDNNKQIYGTASYVAPAAEGTSAVVLATGTEKMGIDGGAEFEYTLTIAEDGTMTLSYAPTATGLNNIKANVKAAKHIANGQIVIVRENKEYNILGAAL